jgi:hypothetical protein
MDRAMIDRYEKGGATLRRSLTGLSRTDALAHPGPGKWSIQELVIHLADSDLIASDRMKRIIAEDNPAIIGFDETRFVANLHSDEQSLDDAVTLFEVNRRQTARILRKLPDAAFARQGTHNERGPVTLAQIVETYTAHLDHHLKFLYEKRARLGKPLA